VTLKNFDVNENKVKVGKVTLGIAGAAGCVHDDGRCGGGGWNSLPLQLRQVVVARRLLALRHHVPEGDQGHVAPLQQPNMNNL
jgi:hypothetical protein